MFWVDGISFLKFDVGGFLLDRAGCEKKLNFAITVISRPEGKTKRRMSGEK
jgi:hypothetical protein